MEKYRSDLNYNSRDDTLNNMILYNLIIVSGPQFFNLI
jgi:hypothetical protein